MAAASWYISSPVTAMGGMCYMVVTARIAWLRPKLVFRGCWLNGRMEKDGWDQWRRDG